MNPIGKGFSSEVEKNAKRLATALTGIGALGALGAGGAMWAGHQGYKKHRRWKQHLTGPLGQRSNLYADPRTHG